MRGASIVPIRGGISEDAAEDVNDLLVTITTIENRVLRLVREGGRDIPVDDLTQELSLLSRDLRRSYRRIIELTERRDLSFRTQQTLRRLQAQCVWLYRKVHGEGAFFRKLALEGSLRRLISQDALNLYQQILSVDDEERRLTASDDAAVAAFLLEEPVELPAPDHS